MKIIGEKFTSEPGECTIKFIITTVLSVVSRIEGVGGEEAEKGGRERMVYQMDAKFIH